MAIRIDGTNTTANPGITGADADTGLQFGTDEVKIVTGGSTAVTVDSSQRVGIGTTSPAAPLVLYNSAASMRFQNSNTGTGASDGLFVGMAGSNSLASYVYNYENADLVFGTNGSEVGKFDSSGRLLVGTSSAVASGTEKIQAKGSLSLYDPTASVAGAGETINFRTDGGATGAIKASISGQNDSTYSYAGRLVFSTTADGGSSPTERMRINSSGAILVDGNAVPTAGAGAYVAIRGGDNTCIMTRRIGTAARDHLQFINNNGKVGSITTSASATAYNTSSDYRLKENVVPLTGAADRVNQLQVRRFNFIADPDTTVDGFIAHEAQAVVPEAVTGTHNEVDADGNPVYQGIDQSKLVPLLTAALQEALGRIETLEAKVTALEGGQP
jgi:hypothetical protein